MAKDRGAAAQDFSVEGWPISRLQRALEFPDDVDFALQDAMRIVAALPSASGPEYERWLSSANVRDD